MHKRCARSLAYAPESISQGRRRQRRQRRQRWHGVALTWSPLPFRHSSPPVATRRAVSARRTLAFQCTPGGFFGGPPTAAGPCTLVSNRGSGRAAPPPSFNSGRIFVVTTRHERTSSKIAHAAGQGRFIEVPPAAGALPDSGGSATVQQSLCCRGTQCRPQGRPAWGIYPLAAGARNHRSWVSFCDVGIRQEGC